MKNAKTTRLLVLVLSLVLLIGSAVGIAASADGTTTTTAPEIISENVSYDGDFSLMYAVSKSSVTGSSVTLNVYDELPADTSAPIWSKTLDATAATETVNGTDAYVFTTPGIATKDMSNQYYIQAVSGDAKSDVMRYSVAEYAFERLYANDVISATEEASLVRAELYLAIIEFGAKAENVLYNYNTDTTDDREYLVSDMLYVVAKDGTVDDTFNSAIVAPGDTVNLVYTGTLTDDERVVAWNVTYYDENGNKTTDTVAPETDIKVTSHMVCTPKISNGPVTSGTAGTGVYYANTAEIEGTRFDCDTIANAYSSFASQADTNVATIYDDEYVQHSKGNATTRTFFRYNNTTTKPADATNLVQVVEADMAFGGVSIADGNDPANPYIIATYFNNIYSAIFLDVNTDGKVTLVSSHIKYGENIELDLNTWYNIRVELYNTSGAADLTTLTKADQNTLTLKLFINGKCVADLYAMDAGCYANYENRMNVILQPNSNGYNDGAWVCFDNVYLGYDDKAYTQYTPDFYPTLSGTAGTGVYYNNADAAGLKIDYSSSDDAVTPSNTDVSFAQIINETLYFQASLDEGEAVSSSGTTITFTASGVEVPENATAFIAEFDMAFGGLANTGGPSLQFDLNSSLESKYGRYYFGAQDGALKSYFHSKVSGDNISLEANTWYNIRMEQYYMTDVSKYLVKIYVNDVWYMDMYSGDGSKAGSANSYFKIAFRQFAQDGDWVIFDNMYLGYSTDAYKAGDPTAQ